MKSWITSVWETMWYGRFSDIEEFRFFAEAFARQAVRDGRNIVYVRFAQHEPVLRDLSGIKVRRFDPDDGFEAFTVAIHEEISREGRDAFYVFDCLSELQSVWYTDLMMGNFFRVTCPYLFELDTVAYFPLLRGRHSFDAVARIRDTTQLLLDVYSGAKGGGPTEGSGSSDPGAEIYLHPLKVWNRHSARMFLPHCCTASDGTFRTIEDGVGMSRYYQITQRVSAGSQDQNYDSHDRFFARAKLDFSEGRFTSETEEQIIASTMTRDERLKSLVKTYFQPVDYFMLRDRMIGSGAIGGKACGMLLARKIAEKEIPEYLSLSEPHDSFYIGSDVFYTYIVSNGCWKLRIRQRTEKEYFSAAEELKEYLLNGEFPSRIREQFLNVIEYFGQSPFIVPLFQFPWKTVSATPLPGNMNQSSVSTREARRNALPISNRRCAGCTPAPWTIPRWNTEGSAVWRKRTNRWPFWCSVFPDPIRDSISCPAPPASDTATARTNGIRTWIRTRECFVLSWGLEQKLVDRTKEDYPRLANLDRPTATVLTTVEQKHKFSQRYVDVLDCKRKQSQGGSSGNTASYSSSLVQKNSS